MLWKRKKLKKQPRNDPKADDSKPLGFEKGHIYDNDDVTSRAGNEDFSFFTDQVKVNHTVTHKDMDADEVVSDNSKTPSFEKFIKENKACSRLSSISRADKCSISFSNYSRKYLKGFSFIDEMNRMIEVEDNKFRTDGVIFVAPGSVRSVFGSKNYVFKFEDLVKEKWAAISDLEQSKPLNTKLTDLKSHLKLWKSQMVQGIMLDGVWNTQPKDIKSGFLDFYKDKFSFHDSLVSWTSNQVYISFMLKINIHKSNIHRVKVSSNEVKIMASYTGSKTGSFPFTYLDLPIGSNMSRIANWQPFIDCLRLDYRVGRPTFSPLVASLLLSNISEDSKKLTWVKWSNILASLEKGGLGVGSFKVFNMSLLLKWRWLFFNNLNALWVHVVKAIHGDEAGFDIRGHHTNRIWANIVSHGTPQRIRTTLMPSLLLPVRSYGGLEIISLSTLIL
nr:RNA-directed DNA polymerase, eukaryota, reverse transcriptase zinc-binding domain protein [Tanacetum cinerariifolium]